MPRYIVEGLSRGQPIRRLLPAENALAAGRKAWFPVLSVRLYVTKAEGVRHAAHARRLFRQLVKGPVLGVSLASGAAP